MKSQWTNEVQKTHFKPVLISKFTVFLGTGKRWILLGVIAAIVVAVVALVLACVAITLLAVDKSASDDDKNDDEIKRLDEYQNRIQKLEQQLNINGNVEKPEVSEIRPVDAFQISVYTDNSGTKHPAVNTLDGFDDTFMHTNKHTNPWWCADLQDIYHIKRVVVTNRKGTHDVHIARATNLHVGITSTRPQVGENLALNAYTLCEQKPGYMGPVGIVNCPDGVSGQYLIVQFETNNWMHIAEVQIYGYKDQL